MKFTPGEGPQNPTDREVEKQLKETAWGTKYEEELDAKRMRLPMDKYRKVTNVPDLDKPIVDHDSKTTIENSKIIDFINRWERDNRKESQPYSEQLPPDVEVINNSAVSQAKNAVFLSYVLRMARKKMKDDVNYERYSNVLGNLTDVYKIEIKNIANNTLQFDVHANTQAILKKHPVLFILKLDSDGEIILL